MLMSAELHLSRNKYHPGAQKHDVTPIDPVVVVCECSGQNPQVKSCVDEHGVLAYLSFLHSVHGVHELSDEPTKSL
jgi:hypothetical protein|tara:strand:- start:1667 stop:1894 length:228 start_codon:yes stop_codon:yes gene_type:complete